MSLTHVRERVTRVLLGVCVCVCFEASLHNVTSMTEVHLHELYTLPILHNELSSFL